VSDPQGPSFLEAVPEQLGMKLKPAKSPLNVLGDRCGLAMQVLHGRAARWRAHGLNAL
jgi:hypothetical protein